MKAFDSWLKYSNWSGMIFMLLDSRDQTTEHILARFCWKLFLLEKSIPSKILLEYVLARLCWKLFFPDPGLRSLRYNQYQRLLLFKTVTFIKVLMKINIWFHNWSLQTIINITRIYIGKHVVKQTYKTILQHKRSNLF